MMSMRSKHAKCTDHSIGFHSPFGKAPQAATPVEKLKHLKPAMCGLKIQSSFGTSRIYPTQFVGITHTLLR